MSLSPWKSTVCYDGRNRHLVTLTHAGAVILSRMVKGPGAKREAMRQGAEWCQQARAGLIEPIPERERLQRLAAASLAPPAAQQFDLSALPLFGDQAKQSDLLDLLKG